MYFTHNKLLPASVKPSFLSLQTLFKPSFAFLVLISVFPAVALETIGLTSDTESMSSSVNALSDDGTIAAGDFGHNALVWSDERWTTQTLLPHAPTPDSNYHLFSKAYALNADGSVVAGYDGNQRYSYTTDNISIGTTTEDSNGNMSSSVENTSGMLIYTTYGITNWATAWNSTEWQNLVDLEEMNGFASNYSRILALSQNGQVAAGSALEGSKTKAKIWSGADWQTVTDLGEGIVNALSGNGVIAGGEALERIKSGVGYSSRSHAKIWSGENWATKTDLGTLKADNSGNSSVNALSNDGTIAGGYAENDNDQRHGTIWSGENWAMKTELGTWKADNSGSSAINALSNNGLIAGGYATNDNNEERATIWYGANWARKIDLGTLRSDNTGSSRVNALSADGKTAGGWVHNENGVERAVIWRGYALDETTSQTATETTTSSANTEPAEISTDTASTADSASGENSVENSNATVTTPTQTLVLSETTQLPKLQITPENHTTNTASTVDNVSSINSTETSQTTNTASTTNNVASSNANTSGASNVVAVDVQNMAQSLQQMGNDSFRMIALQNHQLKQLINGCVGSCVRVSGNASAEGSLKNQAAALSLGYGFNNHFSAGVSVGRALHQSLPESYKRSRNNVGLGAFARVAFPTSNGEFYVAPALAWDRYNVEMARTLLANTENGTGNSRVKSLAYSLKVGHNQKWNNNDVDWYAGVRQVQTKRAAYDENNAQFAVHYDEMTYRDTAAFAGTQLGVAVSPNLQWLVGAEVEQRLGGKKVSYKAHADGIGMLDYTSKVAQTRYQAHTGLRYAFTPAVNVEIVPYVGRNDAGKGYWGSQLNFSAKF